MQWALPIMLPVDSAEAAARMSEPPTGAWEEHGRRNAEAFDRRRLTVVRFEADEWNAQSRRRKRISMW
jgi:hypothetical protein